MLRPRNSIKYPRTSRPKSWRVRDLAKAYQFPVGSLPGGAVIGIVELGGGWQIADVAEFCDINAIPVPNIVDVSVDGTKNDYGKGDADGEVALDIQVACVPYSMATGLPAQIRIYWVRDDIAAAVRAAYRDGCDVFSISWGERESEWGQALQDMEQAAFEAVSAGMVVFAASGDNNSGDSGVGANVDAPSCCPHVVGCGGTRLPRGMEPEAVWNSTPGNPSGEGTGGGFSRLFARPPWQNGGPASAYRMVPDLAANADPDTGYEIIVGGQTQIVGGTSAVAPLYAGLFAAFGRKLGFVSDVLWQRGHMCFNDVTGGDNGLYRALVGPDPCTGLGSPIGGKLLELLAPIASVTPLPPAPAPLPDPGPGPVPPIPAPPINNDCANFYNNILLPALAKIQTFAPQLVPKSAERQFNLHVFMTAVSGHEAHWTARRQEPGGQAHGLFQIEQPTVKLVLNNPATYALARNGLRALGITAGYAGIWEMMTKPEGDVLSVLMARLIIWADPHPLPPANDPLQGWQYYLKTWNPGARTPQVQQRWNDVHAQVLRAVKS